MLTPLYHLIRTVTSPLYHVIYQSRFFFIDYWSLVHFVNGLLIMTLFLRFRVKRRYEYFAAILLGWEISERIFEYLALRVFRTELLPDQVTDLVIGGLGGLAALCFAFRRRRTPDEYAGAPTRRDVVSVPAVETVWPEWNYDRTEKPDTQ